MLEDSAVIRRVSAKLGKLNHAIFWVKTCTSFRWLLKCAMSVASCSSFSVITQSIMSVPLQNPRAPKYVTPLACGLEDDLSHQVNCTVNGGNWVYHTGNVVAQYEDTCMFDFSFSNRNAKH